jgi:hypothetical protein
VRRPLDQSPRSNWQVYEKQILAMLDESQTNQPNP